MQSQLQCCPFRCIVRSARALCIPPLLMCRSAYSNAVATSAWRPSLHLHSRQPVQPITSAASPLQSSSTSVLPAQPAQAAMQAAPAPAPAVLAVVQWLRVLPVPPGQQSQGRDQAATMEPNQHWPAWLLPKWCPMQQSRPKLLRARQQLKQQKRCVAVTVSNGACRHIHANLQCTPRFPCLTVDAGTMPGCGMGDPCSSGTSGGLDVPALCCTLQAIACLWYNLSV